MKNDIIVFQERIARELLDKGFKIKSVDRHKREAKKLVYYFERTAKIEETLANDFSIYV